MRITFNRREFLKFFDQIIVRYDQGSEFGNEASISKLHFRQINVYQTWHHVFSSVHRGVYVRFNSYKLEDFVCFVDKYEVLRHLEVLQDMMNHVTASECGEFFVTTSLPKLQHQLPIFSFYQNKDGDYALVPSCEDWISALQKRVVKEWRRKKNRVVVGGVRLNHALVDCFQEVDFKLANDFKIVVFTASSQHLSSYLSSGSCVIIVTSEFKCWFSHMLIPFVHYIPMTLDAVDVETTLTWCFEHVNEVEKIASNARLFFQQHLNKDAIVSRLNQLFSDNDNRVTSSTALNVDIAPVSFNISWLSYEPSVNDATMQHLSDECARDCFFQAVAQCSYLQWHHGLWASKNFSISIKRIEQNCIISELFDHVFVNMPYSVTIHVDPKHVFYINETSLTNFPLDAFGSTPNNLADVCDVFEKHPFLKDMCQSIKKVAMKRSFKDAYEFIYLNFYKRSSTYERRWPCPFMTFKKGIKTNVLPISFDLNTNKLVVYRHYQILKNALSRHHLEFYEKCLEMIEPTRVDFSLLDMSDQDPFKIKYGERFYVDLPETNDSLHQRLLLEMEVVFSKSDKHYYQSFFKDLLKIDKIQYSINYALLKTIKTFTEQ